MAVETIHERIERERKAVAPSDRPWDYVKKIRDYVRGIQPKTLNADQVRMLAAVNQNAFADNILRKILEEHTSRVNITRFDVDDETVSDFLYDTWVKNLYPDLALDVTYATYRDGNHAVMLDWLYNPDPNDEWGGRVRLTRERWWDGKSGVFVMYDDAGSPQYAVKEWKTLDGEQRRNIYYPEYFSRYVWDEGEWRYKVLPEDEAIFARSSITGLPITGIIPWVKRDGSPIGIPVIHFSNGSDNDSYYGASLLAGGVLGFQDQINALQYDLTAAAMLNGSPQTWSKGFDQPRNDQDELIPFATGPGTHHHSDSDSAAWGTLAPGDLSKLYEAYLGKIQAVCRVTSTPLHTITNQWPSGEAIYRAEMPIVGDTKRFIKSTGPAHSSIAHRATELANAFGRGPELDEDALITAVFEPPEQRDPLTIWAVAEKMAPFVSNKEVLRFVGKTPAEIDTIEEERTEEKEESISLAQSAFSRPMDTNTLLNAGGSAVRNQGNNIEGNEDGAE